MCGIRGRNQINGKYIEINFKPSGIEIIINLNFIYKKMWRIDIYPHFEDINRMLNFLTTIETNKFDLKTQFPHLNLKKVDPQARGRKNWSEMSRAEKINIIITVLLPFLLMMFLPLILTILFKDLNNFYN